MDADVNDDVDVDANVVVWVRARANDPSRKNTGPNAASHPRDPVVVAKTLDVKRRIASVPQSEVCAG